jgi:uncharacterized protein with NAD-binding domain and iron-sulfur cluster
VVAKHGVRVRLNDAVKALFIRNHRLESVELRREERLSADCYVAAVPFERLLDLLPREVIESHRPFGELRRLATSPITSVHLWYNRPVTAYPHLVLIECIGQWVFNRGETRPGENYVQVVVSAARQFRGLGHDEIRRRVIEEMAQLFPGADAANVLRARVVTEHAATFSAIPGVDRFRPTQTTPIPNLFLAGDWTATGWPATMEGAVRSGYLAAEAVLRRAGISEKLLQPDL